jgi:DHA3 family tetracycline resistance protein-like MFS transporter
MVKHPLHGSATDLGMVFAAGGLGSVICAVAVGQRGIPRRNMTVMYVAWTAATLAVAGYGLATAIWQLMLASLAFNALETAGTIIWATVKQRHVPGHLLGRVSSLDWLISIGLLPLSFALTGPAAAAFGAQATLVGAGVLGAIVTAAALLVPGTRAVESPRPRSGAQHAIPGVAQDVELV